MRAPSRVRTLPTLGLLLVGLVALSHTAQAAGSSTASGTLQIGVEVVRSCSIDSSSLSATGAFDVTDRAELVRATQSSLALSCGAAETRVTLTDVHLNLIAPSGTMPRLDVEF